MNASALYNLAMTSNDYTDGSGNRFITSASSVYSNDTQPYEPFDGTGNLGGSDCWHPNSGVPQWLQLQLSSPMIIKGFTMYSRSNYVEHPTAFTFQGSNDGTTWDNLESFSWTVSGYGLQLPCAVPDYSTGYTYFRWYITGVTSSPYAVIAKIIFTDVEEPSDHYTVQYYDGSGGTATQDIDVGVATALETPFSKRNYRLLGWDTSSAGTTVVYTPGQTVTDIAQSEQTINLYAVWRKAWAYILMDDNGDYYSVTQSGATQTLVALTGISTLTAAVFYGQGFQFIPDSTILKTLTNPKVYLWSDDALPDLAVEVEAVPYPQAVMTEVDFNPAYITGIKEFEVTYTGNVAVGYTYDGTTPSTTMTMEAFLALDPDDIYDGLTSAKKLYIYFYLEDEDAVLTRLTVHYKRRKFH